MLKRPRHTLIKQGVAYKHSNKQESSLAKKLGARTTKASGAKQEKGDVRKNGIYRLECKATSLKSFSVTRETLYKIQTAAASASEIPALIVEFLNERGTIESGFAVIPVEDLLQLLQKLNELIV